MQANKQLVYGEYVYLNLGITQWYGWYSNIIVGLRECLLQKIISLSFFFFFKKSSHSKKSHYICAICHCFFFFFSEYYSAILSTVMDSLAVSSLAGEILPGAQGLLSWSHAMSLLVLWSGNLTFLCFIYITDDNQIYQMQVHVKHDTCVGRESIWKQKLHLYSKQGTSLVSTQVINVLLLSAAVPVGEDCLNTFSF